MSDLLNKYLDKYHVSLYDLSLDIGCSESSLYSYKTNYNKVSNRMKERIENYLKKGLTKKI